MWLKARDTLNRIADLAEKEDVTFTLENLNLPVDHPGVPFARAEDTLALVSSVEPAGPAAQSRPLSCADRRGEPDRTVPRLPALDRRDPGGRRAGTNGARHRRDQLQRNRPCAEGHGLSRAGLHGGVRLRRSAKRHSKPSALLSRSEEQTMVTQNAPGRPSPTSGP